MKNSRTGNEELLVAKDSKICGRFLKIIYFVAIMEGTLVKGLARLFRDNI